MNNEKKYSVSDLEQKEISKEISFRKDQVERIINSKEIIEEELEIEIQEVNGKVKISTKKENIENLMNGEKALNALKWGFQPETTLKLTKPTYDMQEIDLKKYRGKLREIKGRIIGKQGKTKKRIAKLTNSSIMITKRRAIVIGEFGNIELAIEAIKMIASGQRRQNVYKYLHNQKRKQRWA